MVSEEADKSRSDSLKQSIVEYFQSANPTENYVVPDKVTLRFLCMGYSRTSLIQFFYILVAPLPVVTLQWGGAT